MAPKITAALLADPDLTNTISELKRLISKRYLPGLGQEKLDDAEYEPDRAPPRRPIAHRFDI